MKRRVQTFNMFKESLNHLSEHEDEVQGDDMSGETTDAPEGAPAAEMEPTDDMPVGDDTDPAAEGEGEGDDVPEGESELVVKVREILEGEMADQLKELVKGVQAQMEDGADMSEVADAILDVLEAKVQEILSADDDEAEGDDDMSDEGDDMSDEGDDMDDEGDDAADSDKGDKMADPAAAGDDASMPEEEEEFDIEENEEALELEEEEEFFEDDYSHLDDDDFEDDDDDKFVPFRGAGGSRFGDSMGSQEGGDMDTMNDMDDMEDMDDEFENDNEEDFKPRRNRFDEEEEVAGKACDMTDEEEEEMEEEPVKESRRAKRK